MESKERQGPGFLNVLSTAGFSIPWEQCPSSHSLSSMVFSPDTCWAARERQDMEGLSPWEAKGHLVGPGQNGWIGGHGRLGFSYPQEPVAGAFLDLPGPVPSRRRP